MSAVDDAPARSAHGIWTFVRTPEMTGRRVGWRRRPRRHAHPGQLTGSQLTFVKCPLVSTSRRPPQPFDPSLISVKVSELPDRW